MNAIKVSILCVAYNTGKYVRKTLESLRHQTLEEIEVICIDNGSQDDSLDIFQEYQQKDSRFCCYNVRDTIGIRELTGLPNSTDYGACINYGFSLAKGDYVYILDCDDWIDFNTLELLYERAVLQDLDVLAFNTILEYEHDHLREVYRNLSLHFNRKTPCEEVLDGKSFINFYEERNEYQWNVFFALMKRSFLEENRIRFSYFGADILFTFQLLLMAKRVSTYSENFHHYLMRDNSGTASLAMYKEYTCKKLQMTYIEMITTCYYHNCTIEKDPYLFRIINKSVFFVYLNFLTTVNSDEVALMFESLLNYNKALFGGNIQNFSNIFTTKEDFFKKREHLNPLCFFGAGIKGAETLTQFQECGLTLPVAICDNSPEKQGSDLEGISVLSVEEMTLQYPDCHILVTNQRYNYEILTQLVEIIPEERLWFYR